MRTRIAVLGAFPFPLPQGSQVLARDQARALAAAGADVTLLCYGRGACEAPEGRARWTAPEALDVVRAPRALSLIPLRAGPSPGKPLADAALLATYFRACRRRRFDAVIAHNGEAAAIALAARPLVGVPVVYAAHTLLGHELATYSRERFARPLAAAGRALDRAIAKRADAAIALCDAAARELAPISRGPVEVIPPGLEAAPAPEKALCESACARLGLQPGRFALYAGNLDAYQGLELLARAARLLPEVPFVAATHASPRRDLAPVRVAQLPAEEIRALTFAAGVAVLPRALPGGFPIKLLNYMDAGRPIVAHEGVADGFVHDRSAWLLESAEPTALADAVATLLADPARAARLGRGARELLAERHAWPDLAARTLGLVRKVRAAARGV